MSEKSLFDVFGGESFDPNSVPPADEFDVLPAGKYPVIVESAEVKATKKGDGYILKLKMSVLDGIGKGRKLWDNINVRNPSAECQELGLKMLGHLCVATGVPVIDREHSEQLLVNKTCLVRVKVDGTFNKVTEYEPLGQPAKTQDQPAAPAKQPTSNPEPATASSAPANGKPIWNR